jgi:hypothetical protein
MNITRDKAYVTDPNLRWIYPHEETPPSGVKLALLTIGGVQVTGLWRQGSFIAWQRLFKRDKEKESYVQRV